MADKLAVIAEIVPGGSGFHVVDAKNVAYKGDDLSKYLASNEEEVGDKADKEYVDTELAKKANASDFNAYKTSNNAEVAKKANTSDVNTELGKKLNTSDFNTYKSVNDAAVAGKVNKSYVDTELAKKANTSDLAGKANASDVAALQTAVNNKADGTTVSALAGRVSTNETNIAAANARIDGIVAIPPGSTEGNTELIDIRTGSDGKNYATAGDAVRQQITDLKSDLNKNISRGNVVDITGSVNFTNGSFVRYADCITVAGADYKTSAPVLVKPNESIVVYTKTYNTIAVISVCDNVANKAVEPIAKAGNDYEYYKYINKHNVPVYVKISTTIANECKVYKISALDFDTESYTGIVPSFDKWVVGYTNDFGQLDTNNTYSVVRTGLIDIESKRIKASVKAGYRCIINYYKNGVFVKQLTWFTGELIIPSYDANQIAVLVQKQPASEIVDGGFIALTYLDDEKETNLLSYNETNFNKSNAKANLVINGNEISLTHVSEGTWIYVNQIINISDMDSVIVKWDNRATTHTYSKVGIGYSQNGTIVSKWVNQDIPNNFIVNTGKENYLVVCLYLCSGETSTAWDKLILQNLGVYENKFDAFTVPDYYFTDNYLDNKVSQIDELIRGCAANGDAFFFISDIHWDKQNMRKSPALIHYLSTKLNIPRLFNGGDNADGCENDVNKYFRESFDGSIYAATGNHEYSYSAKRTDNDVYYVMNMYNDKAVFGSTEKNYYYVDNTQQKIRYIVLNPFKTAVNDHSDALNGIDTAQKNWLRDVALDVESDWTVLVFIHSIYTNTWVSASDNKMKYEYTSTQEIESIIENSDANVACILQGHTHCDRIMKTPVKNIPVVITNSDCGFTAEQDVIRTPNTIREQCFEVVILDKTLRKLTFVRIGAKARNGVGADNYGSEVEYREVTY